MLNQLVFLVIIMSLLCSVVAADLQDGLIVHYPFRLYTCQKCSTCVHRTDASSFAIDTATGQLKTKMSLDYETKNSYSVTIGAVS